MVSIYILLRDGIPFYVGKTESRLHKRYKEHCRKYGSDIEIFEVDCVDRDTWEFWEKFYISLFKYYGFKLDNIALGGSGCTWLNFDKAKRYSVIEKMSKSKMGIRNHMYGKKRPISYIEDCKIRNTGCKNPMFGKVGCMNVCNNVFTHNTNLKIGDDIKTAKAWSSFYNLKTSYYLKEYLEVNNIEYKKVGKIWKKIKQTKTNH